MDAIAMRLTLAATAAAAWNTIFQRPSGKQWDQVTVAIKVNCSNLLNMPRIAVIGKVCKELMALGVLQQNITLYDSCANAWGAGRYTDAAGKPVAGLPAGITVANADKTTDTGPLVPVGGGALKCSSVVARKNADNSISYLPDIIVNCAVNKGHLDAHGGFTMLMKNHIGTMKYDCPTAQELLDINQSEAIIGTVSAELPCRQQLCIIDSLWASATGPTGTFTHVPCRITMGTLAPVVDYCVAKNIRSTVMKTAYNTAVVNNWLSAFGYAPTDPIWIELSASTGLPRQAAPRASGTTIQVTLSGKGRRPAGISFNAPLRNQPVFLRLTDLRGRTVRTATLQPTTGNVVAWDDAGSGGGPLPAGTYTIRCTMGTWVNTTLLTF